MYPAWIWKLVMKTVSLLYTSLCRVSAVSNQLDLSELCLHEVPREIALTLRVGQLVT